ncbi:MAG: helix-turn-helix domain-containing protein [Acidimicrobiia bacterium]
MSQKRNTGRWFRVLPTAGLGPVLARCRHQRGLTQAELADRLGVDRTTILRTEASDVAALRRVVAAFSILGYELIAVPKGADVVIASRGEA